MTPLEPHAPPNKRHAFSRPITVVIVGLFVLCVALAVLITALVRGRPTKASVTPVVPTIENISRPNAACTPAADRKLGLGDDLSRIQWFGWLDGKQTDMPVGQALSLRISGHDVRDAWYCPPRADWK